MGLLIAMRELVWEILDRSGRFEYTCILDVFARMCKSDAYALVHIATSVYGLGSVQNRTTKELCDPTIPSKREC
ncbi:hypothetical protein HBH56_097380 [Parastagonospora nodorum]|uniref:Uncharacterized protein n=1 Tax=Phaeosphaeria nodorum (strain SN15 / ATCC MYA-4574 / FGSC 10173) TaxID=321614 RepID=A0A7U2NR11_PHANO|nr:hypothetical protein HBH56_097380 [Parastagonospora nodorum]QRD07320.1 hypothetical protein JI435_424230 [Parastagonospora nodorum SN15]KAH3930124.1 hypothetical protein HBH54_111700 [Parastagonospora nodorum]KAH4003072.1 hypothetical protein HBI10_067750 [Parastagonospora nodorum]KAH4026855.1 hypothetical protein HBI09_144990 [Parastagonospora nodorum]